MVKTMNNDDLIENKHPQFGEIVEYEGTTKDKSTPQLRTVATALTGIFFNSFGFC